MSRYRPLHVDAHHRTTAMVAQKRGPRCCRLLEHAARVSLSLFPAGGIMSATDIYPMPKRFTLADIGPMLNFPPGCFVKSLTQK